jgi:hypothetical protein
MRAKGVGVCLSAISILLVACGTAPPELAFSKPGVTDAQRDSDIHACWEYALNSPEGRKSADMVNGARIIGGGPIALVVMAAEKSANKGDPKKDMANWAAHSDCMAAKGYTQRLAD